jgi:hypothetical protein
MNHTVAKKHQKRKVRNLKIKPYLNYYENSEKNRLQLGLLNIKKRLLQKMTISIN